MHPLTYYIDESIKILDGEEICALIAINTIDPSKLTSLISDSIDSIISDPICNQHNQINDTWIPHFCNDHPFDVHPIFLSNISQMPFEAYIVFGHKNNFSKQYEYDWYDNLLKILFTYRLSADKGRIERVVYEQHDSQLGKREAHLQALFQTMAKKDANRRKTKPADILVTSAGKDVLPLCLPDYIGGCFMAYLCDSKKPLGARRRSFERIANKVRWIKNADSGEIFTSKHPFIWIDKDISSCENSSGGRG